MSVRTKVGVLLIVVTLSTGAGAAEQLVSTHNTQVAASGEIAFVTKVTVKRAVRGSEPMVVIEFTDIGGNAYTTEPAPLSEIVRKGDNVQLGRKALIRHTSPVQYWAIQ